MQTSPLRRLVASAVATFNQALAAWRGSRPARGLASPRAERVARTVVSGSEAARLFGWEELDPAAEYCIGFWSDGRVSIAMCALRPRPEAA